MDSMTTGWWNEKSYGGQHETFHTRVEYGKSEGGKLLYLLKILLLQIINFCLRAT